MHATIVLEISFDNILVQICQTLLTHLTVFWCFQGYRTWAIAENLLIGKNWDTDTLRTIFVYPFFGSFIWAVCQSRNTLSANPTKWSNTLKQFECAWLFCGVGTERVNPFLANAFIFRGNKLGVLARNGVK